MVEEDAVAGEQAVGFAVVDGLPVGDRPWRRRRGCAGRRASSRVCGVFDDLAVHLAGGGLVEADRRYASVADGFEQAHRAEGVDVGGVFGLVEADADVAIGRRGCRSRRAGSRGQMSREAGAVARGRRSAGSRSRWPAVRVAVEVVDAAGVEGAGAADDAVDFVAFGEQELGQIGAVLAGDAGDRVRGSQDCLSYQAMVSARPCEGVAAGSRTPGGPASCPGSGGAGRRAWSASQRICPGSRTARRSARPACRIVISWPQPRLTGSGSSYRSAARAIASAASRTNRNSREAVPVPQTSTCHAAGVAGLDDLADEGGDHVAGSRSKLSPARRG